MSTLSRKTRFWGFLAFSIGWTWSFWTIASLFGTSIWIPPALWFFIIGGMGVFLGGIVMTLLMYGVTGLRDLARRVVDPRPIGRRWWAVVLLLFPSLTVLAGALVGVFGTTQPSLNLASTATLLASPASLAGLIGFTLIIGPVPEEIGWRGYFLDQLQARRNVLSACLIIGLLHWMWHLPLFVLPGYWAVFSAPPSSPLDLALVVLPATVFYTWVYNGTGRSVLAVILLHFTGNFSGELFGISKQALTIRLVLVAIVALLIVWRWGLKMIRRQPGPTISKATSDIKLEPLGAPRLES